MLLLNFKIIPVWKGLDEWSVTLKVAVKIKSLAEFLGERAKCKLGAEEIQDDPRIFCARE